MKSILVTTLLILSAANAALGQCSEADKQKLMAFDKAWGEAGQRGDRAYLQNVYADDYMNTSLAGTLSKAQAIENAARDAERRRAAPAPRLVEGHQFLPVALAALAEGGVGGGENQQSVCQNAFHVRTPAGTRETL